MKRNTIAKMLICIMLAFTMLTVPEIVQAAYTIGSFTPYTQPNEPVPNDPLPYETKDGIVVSSDMDIFANKQGGMTLNEKIKVDGCSLVFKLESWDGNFGDYPAISIGFTKELGMITWNCQMDGTGKGGFMFQYRFPNPDAPEDKEKFPYFEFNELIESRNIRMRGNSQNLTGIADGGTDIRVTFREDDERGYIISVNGVDLTNNEGNPIDLNFMRNIADDQDGKMYLNFTAHNQAVFQDKTIKYTVKYINGKRVSSLQTSDEPPVATPTLTQGASSEPSSATPTLTSAPSKVSSSSETASVTEVSDIESEEEPEEGSLTDDSGDETSEDLTDLSEQTESADESRQTSQILSKADDEQEKSNTLFIILGIVLVVLIGGGIAAYQLVFKKKKNGGETEQDE